MGKEKKDSIDYMFISEGSKTFAYHLKFYLSIPNGFGYKFRYHKAYIQDYISENIVDTLTGEDAVLAMRDLNSGKILPIRKIKIAKVFDYGNYAFFYVIMQDLKLSHDSILKDYNPKSTVIEKYISKANQKVITNISPDIKSIASQYMKCLILKLNNPEPKSDYGSKLSDSFIISSWTKLTYLLRNHNVFAKESFYKIIGIYKITFNGQEELAKPVQLYSGEVGLKIVSGKMYKIEFMQIVPFLGDEIKPYKLILGTLGSHFETANHKYVVDGYYDRFSMYFKPLPQQKNNTFSFLNFSEERQNDNGKEEILPAFRIPVIIKWSPLTVFWRKYLNPIVFVLAILLWICATRIGEYLTIEDNIIRYFSIFLLSFALQNWGSFIKLFRVESESGR